MRVPLSLIGVLMVLSPLGWPSPASASLPGESLLDEAILQRLAPLPERLKLPGPWQEQLESAAGYEQSLQVVLDYYTAQKPAPGLFPTRYTPAQVLQRAEALLQDKIVLLETEATLVRRPDGGIDWHYQGPRGDKEWAWMLNRHDALLELETAWQQTRNPAYAERINTLLQDWILSNDYPDRLTFSAPWRALEVARRILRVWPFLFYQSDALTPQSKLLLLASLQDHADALYEHPSFWGGNHLITEKLALLKLATLWPEFQMAPAWREKAVAKLEAEFLSQSYPDGSYHELSNHYQRVVLVNAAYFVRLLHPDGPVDRTSEVVRRIEKMWDFFAGSIRPDGHGPMNNASDLEYNAAWLLEAGELFARQDWLAIATAGGQGLLPEGNPSRFFPWAGQAFLRSGWLKEDSWLYFDAGPYGSAHQHQDHLHLSLVLEGTSILTDGGRYTYQPGEWKTYFTGPLAHASLLVDGRPPETPPFTVGQPLPITFSTTESTASAQASAAFPQSFLSLDGPILWERTVHLDYPGHTATVTDTIVTFRSTELTFNWPLHPDTNAMDTANFLSIDTSPKADVVIERLPSWVAPEYQQRKKATRLEVRSRINRPTTFTWTWSMPE